MSITINFDEKNYFIRVSREARDYTIELGSNRIKIAEKEDANVVKPSMRK